MQINFRCVLLSPAFSTYFTHQSTSAMMKAPRDGFSFCLVFFFCPHFKFIQTWFWWFPPSSGRSERWKWKKNNNNNTIGNKIRHILDYAGSHRWNGKSDACSINKNPIDSMNPGGLINGSWLLIEALIAQHDHTDEWWKAHPPLRSLSYTGSN